MPLVRSRVAGDGSATLLLGGDLLVLQSAPPRDYRSAMLDGCIQSVRSWAEHQGHEHVFMEDEFFDILPGEARDLQSTNRLAATDLARALWARETTRKGRGFLWVDADVFVADPAVPLSRDAGGEAFAREVWLEYAANGPQAILAVNNSVSYYTPDSAFLDFYIAWCLWEVRRRGVQLTRCHFGTDMLTAMAGGVGLPLLNGVASFSPDMLTEILAGDQALLAAHATLMGSGVNFINLCGSLGAFGETGPDEWFAALRSGITEHNRIARAPVEAFGCAPVLTRQTPTYPFASSWLSARPS